jgi:hypothetical protein
MQTPVPPLFSVRETIPTTGTVPYNALEKQINQTSSVKSRQAPSNASATVADKFLTICTSFLTKLSAISLDEIKFKGSQHLLHFSKLPDNLHLPKDPQNVIEYKE